MGWACGPPLPPGKYTQVVLVTIDTLRADHLQSYGYPRPTSPFIDSLGERGVVFTQANATVSLTAPSHASIFTGLLPLQHGVLQNSHELPSSLPNMAQVLGDAGYRTAAFASNGFLTRMATGFGTVDGTLRRGEYTVRKAISWLENLDPQQPFFLWVHLFDVHEAELTQWGTPESLAATIREGTSLEPDALYDYLVDLHDLPTPSAGEPFPEIRWENARFGGKGRPTVLASREEVIASMDAYDATIAYTDEQIRRLFEAVQDMGTSGPGLWMITADHGEGLGNHGYRGHGQHIYQAQAHVPLIFFATDDSLTPGRVDALVSLVDLFPTVAEIPREFPRGVSTTEGISLWPYLLGKEVEDEGRSIFAQRKPMPILENDLFAVLSDGHKYILNTTGDDQFFDLEADPAEKLDQIGSTSAARYRDLITEKLKEMGWTGTAPIADPAAAPEHVLEELKALGY